MMNIQDKLTATSILLAVLSLCLFGLYKYCSLNDVFWDDLNSTLHVVGVYASFTSFLLSVMGLVFSFLLFFKFGAKNMIIIAALINLFIFFAINGQFLIYILGWLL